MTSETQIRPGYKQTEVGVIPEDWGICAITENAAITTGSKNTQDRVETGAFPFFVRSQTIERINSYSFDGEAVLTAGDGVGTGKVFHYINGKFDFHQRVYKISNFSNLLNGYFFFIYFSNHFLTRIMSMTAKSSVDSVRMEMIAEMNIPLPPYKEQKAIAGALSEADELIEALDALIEKKHRIKEGAMQELLTGKNRLPGFTGEWKEKKLGDLGSFRKGQGVSKGEAQSGNLPCVRYGELYTHHENIIRYYNSRISRGVAKNAMRLQSGDILFAGSGETKEEIGKCAAFIDDIEAFAGGDIVILAQPEGDSCFLGYYLNSYVISAQKASKGQGDAVVHINANALANIEIYIPSTKEEQKAIAQVLTDMDEEIDTLEAKRDKAKLIKQGMMQQLLTGKIRLI